ncbi:MAG: DNA mismatch repair protein MutS [Acidobacteria bacterium]|nr:DNA mismatch repair protein MutS [Acidobacteriota bacterium]
MSTPLWTQYRDIKRQHPGMILFFQIGDFYETFDEDAHTIARELGVTLTRKYFGKNNVRPLAGVPVRSLESHLAKLIHRGFKVAICEQTTPPGKGLVERQVTHIITPGTIIEPGLLEGRANNYLASLVLMERSAGIAYIDISTGEFRATQLDKAHAFSELERIAPAELMVSHAQEIPSIEVRAITKLTDEQIEYAATRRALLHHFDVLSLEAYGCEQQRLATQAAGAIIIYLRDTQAAALTNITNLQSYRADNFMQLDPQTIRNLEVFQGWDFSGGTPTGSLVATIDLTMTQMGGRRLRRWLRHPLLEITELRARQDAIEWFVKREAARAQTRAALEEALDIERVLGRIRRRLAAAVEVLALGQSLQAAAQLRALLEKAKAPADFLAPLEPCQDLVEFIERAISDKPPRDVERGGIIRHGFSIELDMLRDTLTGGRKFLADLENRERQRTGIRSLKVGYNKVFGYYLEVSKANLKLVPNDFIRKQTLTNAERYFTLELKEHEALIANARERILELETNLYRQVCDEIGRHHHRLSSVASGLSLIDLYAALAECAVKFHYTRPEIHEGDELHIVKGRHPMIDQMIDRGKFTPNDTHLTTDEVQIMLLTAPNMAGKSVYLRQVALICLLAQIGSFVPAETARVGIIDHIFTRIGLNDFTLRGHSSFMIEMIETAHILNQATPRSLVLLDEIGRGTSTADGISIARAVVEYLHNQPRVRAKTLFATHYHELTDAAHYLPRVRNFHLAVEERKGKVTYLHKVKEGRAEKSFGIYVAQLAGLPKPVLRRANELLSKYDEEQAPAKSGRKKAASLEPNLQAIFDALLELDVNELSPVEALTKLYDLQRRAREGR